jgi:hypothetical protein
VKQLPDGRWGIYLCKKYWKFKDQPVMYSAAVNERSAQMRVNRLNNPGFYENDENYVSVKQAREKKKREKAKKDNDKKREKEAT